MGRSEQANTFVVDSDLNVLSIVGWVPRVTFFLSEREPTITTRTRMRVKGHDSLRVLKK